jgi:hypothetical protein
MALGKKKKKKVKPYLNKITKVKRAGGLAHMLEYLPASMRP